MFALMERVHTYIIQQEHKYFSKFKQKKKPEWQSLLDSYDMFTFSSYLVVSLKSFFFLRVDSNSIHQVKPDLKVLRTYELGTKFRL